MAAMAAACGTGNAALAAQTGAQLAAAQSPALKLLKLMDTDKSGKVSRAEFMSFMAAEFDRLDTNHDGELDVKELEQLEIRHHEGGHGR
jgi:hypothetical protein